MAKPSRTFRLDALLDERLEEAARNSGMKISNFVEQAVAEKLGEERRLSREVKELRKQLDSFRKDWALSVEAFLVVIGSQESLSPEDAARWVKRNLHT